MWEWGWNFSPQPRADSLRNPGRVTVHQHASNSQRRSSGNIHLYCSPWEQLILFTGQGKLTDCPNTGTTLTRIEQQVVIRIWLTIKISYINLQNATPLLVLIARCPIVHPNETWTITLEQIALILKEMTAKMGLTETYFKTSKVLYSMQPRHLPLCCNYYVYTKFATIYNQ